MADFILMTHLARKDVVSAVKRPHRRGSPREKPVGFTRWTLDGWVGVDAAGTPVGPPRSEEAEAASDVALHVGIGT